MSIYTVTSRITHQWLMRKSKSELASIILNNLDRIDLFAEKPAVPQLCTRDYGHEGPCNGFPRPVCAARDDAFKWTDGEGTCEYPADSGREKGGAQ